MAKKQVLSCQVFLWGKYAGAAAWDPGAGHAAFEYAPDFVRGGIEPSPLVMPLEEGRIYRFPELNRETYLGLPGLLADALPDRFGNALIDAWLEDQGRDKADFNPVERLCYMGTRGMGALEFRPPRGPRDGRSEPIEIAELTRIAGEVLQQRDGLRAALGSDRERDLQQILRVGASAGGARAKAVIAWNPRTDEVRSGQVAPPKGFEPWLLKFDGVNQQTLGDPEGFGRIEYAYYKMATEAGIEMMECRLLEEGSRAHFMTRRFDRTVGGGKIHVQSLCAMAHFDYNAPGLYSYEDAYGVIQRLNLGYPDLEAMYRRMVFNVLARNQDDHTRNIEFLMHPDGAWRLAPAYDMTWNHRSDSPWVSRHQMRIAGKTGGFTQEDLLTVAKRFGIRGAASLIGRIAEAVRRWPEFAAEAGVPQTMIEAIAGTHRLRLLSSR